ncbi:MAG TPA: response regulator [Bacillales bacterium]|nr:response regulator [Bacillales bacterium]
MNESKIRENGLLLNEYVLNEKQMTRFFDVLKANVVRSRTVISAIFLTVYDQSIFQEEDISHVEEEITLFLQSKIRQTDLLFKLSNRFEWCIILSQSGEDEANAFLQRLFLSVKNKAISLLYDISFSASIAEIGNSDVSFEKLIASGREALAASLNQWEWHIEYIESHKERNMEKIKISILEENDIFRNVLQTTLEKLTVHHFQLDIKTFPDGYEFLHSEWFSSSHTHIIIMNDILPRKNGLEVRHKIRKLPNNKRFIIFMMTKRKSEEDMIYAYENGVDEYIIKPFNLRLFEAQLKRTFGRLWS